MKEKQRPEQQQTTRRKYIAESARNLVAVIALLRDTIPRRSNGGRRRHTPCPPFVCCMYILYNRLGRRRPIDIIAVFS